jgi:hypothetical protein
MLHLWRAVRDLQVGEFTTGVTVGVANSKGAKGLGEGDGDGEKTGSATEEKVTTNPPAVRSTSDENTANTGTPGVDE